MMNSDIKIAKMEKDIEHIKNDQNDLKTIVVESHKQLDEKLDKVMTHIDVKFEKHEIDSEKKYSRKYVEHVFWWLLAAIGTALVGALMTLLLK